MSAKTFQSLAGHQGINKLAVDTDYFETRGNLAGQLTTVAAINAVGSLTTVLSLTGKFHIHQLFCTLLSTNDIDHWKLTIDGVIIHEEDGMSSNNTGVGFWGTQDGDWGDHGIICDSSFLLEMECTADNSFSLWYHAQPIL